MVWTLQLLTAFSFCKLNPEEGEKPCWRLSIGSSVVADGDGSRILQAFIVERKYINMKDISLRVQ